MPRVPAVSKPATASVTLVRAGKNGAKAAPITRSVGQEQQQPRNEEEKEVCPLCVEDLDETDKSFQPCPCGYRMCLFCYEKLKLLCNSVCPNCRRAYGSEEAMEYAKKLEAERAQEGLRSKSNSASAATASSSTAAAASVGNRAPPKPIPTHSVRRDTASLPAAKRGSGTMDDSTGHGASSSLPSGVTWANASPNSLSQSVEIERPMINMDDFSWPSLGAPSSQQQQQHPPRIQGPAAQQHANQHQSLNQQHQQHNASGAAAPQATGHEQRHSPFGASEGANSFEMSGADTRRSSSVASSMDRVASSSSLELMSQDPPVTPEQLLQLQHQHQQYQAQHAQVGAASLSSSSSAFPPMPPPGFESAPYFNAQVATTVNGLRRAVHVPLSLGNNVEPYPEMPGLLASMQQSVVQGTVSSKEAATQLYALLRQKDHEGHAARARSMLAATKPPPGFGAPAAHPLAPLAVPQHQPMALHSTSVPGLAAVVMPGARPPPPPGFGNLQGSVVQAPPTIRSPIQPPALQTGDVGTSAGPIGLNANGTPRTYSMWSGLPGMDLSASTGLTSLWQNLTASGLSLGGQLSGGAAQPYNPLGMVEQSLSFGASRLPMANTGAPKPPPPGFGPSAYARVQPGAGSEQLGSGDTVLGSNFRTQHPYQPVGAARYNPLNPPSVMPVVYRPPQLGAGP